MLYAHKETVVSPDGGSRTTTKVMTTDPKAIEAIVRDVNDSQLPEPPVRRRAPRQASLDG
jgi:hypothetical protein